MFVSIREGLRVGRMGGSFPTYGPPMSTPSASGPSRRSGPRKSGGEGGERGSQAPWLGAEAWAAGGGPRGS